MKILVVDDLLIARRSTRLILEEAGYTVETCSDEVRALAVLFQQKFDLAVITHRNPEVLDGIRFSKTVKRLHPETRTLLLSESDVSPPPPEVDLALRWPFKRRYLSKLLKL